MSRHRDSERGEQRSATRNGPPRLRLHLWRRVRMLLLLNAFPLLATLWLGWHASQGRLQLTVAAAPLIWLVIAILTACGGILLALWVVLPVARWLAANPTWHMRHGSRILWALPCLLGHVFSVLLGLVVVLIIGVAIATIVIGLRDIMALEPTQPPSTNAEPAQGQAIDN